MSISPYLSKKLNRLSFLGMLTVVYVHAFNFDDRYLWAGRTFDEPLNLWNFLQVLIANGLLRFGIPLFFLRSGILMAETESRYTSLGRFKKRSKTLLLPYVVWSLIGAGVTFLFEAIPSIAPFAESAWLRPFNNLPVHEWTWTQWLEGVLVQPISFQLWFIRSLFIYSLLYPAISWVLNMPVYKWVYLGFLTVAWLLSMGLFLIEPEGLLFFSLGIWMAKGGFDPERVKRFVYRYGILWALPVFLLVKTHIAFQFSDQIAAGYFLYKFCQPLLVLAVWFGYDGTLGKVDSTPLEGWSRYNFFIYGSHVPLIYYLTDWIFAVYGKPDDFRFAVFAGLPLLVSAIALGFGIILDRFLHPVFWLLTGGRK